MSESTLLRSASSTRSIEDDEVLVDLTAEEALIDLTRGEQPIRVSDVPTELREWARANDIAKIETWRSVRAIGEALAMYAAGVVVGALIGGWPGRIVGWAVILTAMVRMQYLFHESAHRGLFTRKWTNDFLGALIGSLALVPHAAYRAYHIEHHGNTRVDANGRKDPEGFYDEVKTRPMYLVTVIVGGAYFIVWAVVVVVRAVFGSTPDWLTSRRLVKNVRTWGVVSALGSVAAIVGLVTAGMTGEMFTWWLIPVGIHLSSMFTLLNFFEHHGVPRNTPIMHASATIDSPGLLSWLTLNIVYHRAHHVMPTARFYRLPAVEDEIRSIMDRTGDVDRAPRHKSLLGFHLALWRRLPWAG